MTYEPILWDADPDVCCAAFQLGACSHTEGAAYDYQDTMDTTPEPARITLFICRDHAPMGIDPLPYDDGRPTCCVCGKANYAVKPYSLKVTVVDRGWKYAPRSPYARPRVRA